MASNIDPTKPVSGSPTTQSVRDNFSAAKTEIEALQAASGGGGVTITKTQASHGFAVGDAIYYTGSAYAKAKSDAATTLGLWIVSAVDGNDFTGTQAGPVTGLTGLTAGQYYFVSDSTAGALTVTDSSTYSNPILFAISTTEGVVLPFRPSTVGSSSGGTVVPGFSQFRLTTETGVPVSTSDRTSQGTIYLTPYNGNLISLYSGSEWTYLASAEVSLALSSLTSGKNYDVFAYDNSGTLTLELSSAWTDDTTRADALATQDGVYVKSGATTRMLVGTIRTTGTATTEDSATKRFVMNLYNRVYRRLYQTDSTDNWVYTTATWRQARASSLNQVETIDPIGSLWVELEARSAASNTTTAVGRDIAIGIDSTSTPSGIGAWTQIVTQGIAVSSCRYSGYPGVGYHYFAQLEYSVASGTCTWWGDGGSTLGSRPLTLIIGKVLG